MMLKLLSKISDNFLMETLRLRSVFRTNRLAIKDTTIGPGIKIKAGQSNISFRDYPAQDTHKIKLLE